MKKLIYTFAFCALLALAGNAQSTETSTQPKIELIRLSETSYDFGKIPQGKPVTHYFTVENASNDTLKIEQVQASCGCTTPEWKKDPVLAGGKTVIKVGYNSAAEGPFEKSITIYYNGGQVKQLIIKGNVWKTPDQSAPSNQALNVFKQSQQ